MKKIWTIILSFIMVVMLNACSKQSENKESGQTIIVETCGTDNVTEEATSVYESSRECQEAEKYGIYVKVLPVGMNQYCISEIQYGDTFIKYEYYNQPYMRKSKNVNGVVTEYGIGTPEGAQNLHIIRETGDKGLIEYIYEPGYSTSDILTGFIYNDNKYEYKFEYPYTYILDEQGNIVAEYYMPEDEPLQVTNYTDEKIGDIICNAKEGSYYDKETGLYSDSDGCVAYGPNGFFSGEDAAEQIIEYLASYWGISVTTGESEIIGTDEGNNTSYVTVN